MRIALSSFLPLVAVAIAVALASMVAFSGPRAAAPECPSNLADGYGRSFSDIRKGCMGSALRATEGGSVLTCGQLRTMAAVLGDVRWPEGDAAASAFDRYCSLVGDGDAPVGFAEQSGGPLTGVITFDDDRCGGEVEHLRLRDGRISFQAAGFVWKGYVTANGWVVANTAQDEETGAVIGPTSGAAVKLRHCGSGTLKLETLKEKQRQ